MKASGKTLWRWVAIPALVGLLAISLIAVAQAVRRPEVLETEEALAIRPTATGDEAAVFPLLPIATLEPASATPSPTLTVPATLAPEQRAATTTATRALVSRRSKEAAVATLTPVNVSPAAEAPSEEALTATPGDTPVQNSEAPTATEVATVQPSDTSVSTASPLPTDTATPAPTETTAPSDTPEPTEAHKAGPSRTPKPTRTLTRTATATRMPPPATMTNTLPPPTMTRISSATPSPVVPGRITGRLLMNGVPASAGIALHLEDETGQAITQTVVGAGGAYAFGNLRASTEGYNVVYAQEWNTQQSLEQVVSWAWISPVPVANGAVLSLPDLEISSSALKPAAPAPDASFSAAAVSSPSPITFSWSGGAAGATYWVDLERGDEQTAVWRSPMIQSKSTTFDGMVDGGGHIQTGDYWWGVGAWWQAGAYEVTLYSYLQGLTLDP